MADLAGRRIGPYEVLAFIGAGGMGEVYRARDLKLGRDVAIKILRGACVDDPDRRARFQREARVLASLNHPHIGAIYGFEEAEDLSGLVLELVDGATLAERLASGRLPVTDALTVARQIAEALEAAHDKGIIHRDLKPANIKITPQGVVKVLDFGLAKAVAGDSTGGDASAVPTVTEAGTRDGAILGTAAYMSPEQARGQALDTQTDIWAFGCVLYELLTGHAAFAAATTSDTIAAILAGDAKWTALPADTPPNVRRLLQRCLEKDPRRRVHDIADARIEIEDAVLPPPGAHASAVAPARRRAPLARTAALLLGAIAIAAVAASVVLWRRAPAPSATVTRFGIAPPSGDDLVTGNVAISADGDRVAFIGIRNGVRRLFLRKISELEPVLVRGSEDAFTPFFSPDGRSVAFFAGGKLKRASVSGDSIQTVADAGSSRGGAWAPDDSIVFAPSPTGVLYRVPAAGGAVTEFTRLADNERSHRWPHVLPDGSGLLFAAGPVATQTSWNEARIIVQSWDGSQRRVLAPRGTHPRYFAPGYVLYVQATALVALPFDIRRLARTGDPITLSERLVQGGAGSGAVDVSGTGALALVQSPGLAAHSLAWVDRRGQVEPLGISVAAQSQPRLSPDGSRVSYTVAEPDTEIWIHDLARKTTTRLTTGGGNLWPVWTPDGLRITFTSIRTGAAAPFWRPADGSGADEQLSASGMPFSWSPDGKVLGIVTGGNTTGYDLATLSLGNRQVSPFLQTKDNEHEITFSPDGRWAAYVSNESGRNEIYVRASNGAGARWPVSNEGGNEPVWNRNSRELFFRRNDDMMAVDVQSTATGFVAGTPRRLFTGKFTIAGDRPNYDVAPDGSRFIIVKPEREIDVPRQVTVVLNWSTVLRDQIGQH